eukprot:224398-Chlamydomonas_euryale.AAC.1
MQRMQRRTCLARGGGGVAECKQIGELGEAEVAGGVAACLGAGARQACLKDLQWHPGQSGAKWGKAGRLDLLPALVLERDRSDSKTCCRAQGKVGQSGAKLGKVGHSVPHIVCGLQATKAAGSRAADRGGKHS